MLKQVKLLIVEGVSKLIDTPSLDFIIYPAKNAS